MPNGGIHLSGPQLGKLSTLLRTAFKLNRFDELLLYYLDINREDLSVAADYQAIVTDILVDARARNWLHKLIIAARQANPEHPGLLEFAQEFGLATRISTIDNAALAGPATGPQLERTIKKANPFLDVVEFRTRLGQMEGRVCKIELPGDGSGTGFLVNTDVIITNYHVMEEVIKGTVNASDVIVRFDYKRLAKGNVGDGTVYTLAQDWRIHDSPYSNADLDDPPTGGQEVDHLDYSLFRLSTAAATEPIGGAANADPNASPRGFIEKPTAAHDFLKSPALFILQHPDGEPLKLAIDTESVIAVNPNGSRVRYRTNTEAGSSGSPCFDSKWNLVALHHLGDPNWGVPKFNQGIPFTAIQALLATTGAADALG